jgi:hypothetical protein
VSRTLRLVIGQGEATPCAVKALALRAADHARGAGLRFLRLEQSRNARSLSQYLHILDKQGRRWLFRISNHRRPLSRGQETPNFDLVSIDGVSGFGSVTFFLDEIAAGRPEWFDPAESFREPRKRARR